MARFALFFCAVIALITIGAATRARLDKWFDAEGDLLNQNIRAKRSYNSYYQQSGWKKGSNAFERVGNQKRLRCKALTKTATNEWCSENCVRGFCPLETCMCVGDYRSKNYETIVVQKPFYSGNNKYGVPQHNGYDLQ